MQKQYKLIFQEIHVRAIADTLCSQCKAYELSNHLNTHLTCPERLDSKARLIFVVIQATSASREDTPQYCIHVMGHSHLPTRKPCPFPPAGGNYKSLFWTSDSPAVVSNQTWMFVNKMAKCVNSFISERLPFPNISYAVICSFIIKVTFLHVNKYNPKQF